MGGMGLRTLKHAIGSLALIRSKQSEQELIRSSVAAVEAAIQLSPPPRPSSAQLIRPPRPDPVQVDHLIDTQLSPIVSRPASADIFASRSDHLNSYKRRVQAGSMSPSRSPSRSLSRTPPPRPNSANSNGLAERLERDLPKKVSVTISLPP